jgi:hypothetical protein
MPWFLMMTLILFAPLAGVNYYVARKLLYALRNLFHGTGQNIKRALLVAYLYLNALPIIYAVSFFVGGRDATRIFTGEIIFIDLLFVYPFWFALIVNFQLFLVFLCFDVGSFVARRFIRLQLSTWNRVQPYAIILVAVVILIYSGMTTALNTWTVRLSEKTIHLSAEFGNLDGFRIVQISDVQGDGRVTERRLQKYVEQVNSLNPDLILFAGDLVSSGEQYIESTARILGGLRSKYGVYAAVGDHDIFSNRGKVVAALQERGIIVVEDSTVVVRTEKGNVEITGITYTYRKRPTQISLAKATNGGNNSYKILLSHQPAEPLVDYAGQRGYHLFVAGHTHGGGIAFGIPGLFLVAPASFESRYVSGLYREGTMMVSVTNGLGFTLAPLRFHAPAEYTLLRLVK